MTMRFLLPILFVLSAAGLFVWYINPTYQSIKELGIQAGQYNAALTQSSEVKQVRDQLLARRNTFAADDIRRLERLLPNNIDNIRLIIDINDIAARYHLQVTDVSFTSDQENVQGTLAGGNSTLGTLGFSFTVSAGYEDFLAFLNDLQRSLRLIDVTYVKFTTGTTAGALTGTSAQTTKYNVQVKTFWLK